MLFLERSSFSRRDKVRKYNRWTIRTSLYLKVNDLTDWLMFCGMAVNFWRIYCSSNATHVIKVINTTAEIYLASMSVPETNYVNSMWNMILRSLFMTRGHIKNFMTTSSNGNISALLANCAANSPVTGEFPAQRPVTRCFGVFFDLRLNKRLSKQSWGWWFETPSRPLWRQSTILTWEYTSNRVSTFIPTFTVRLPVCPSARSSLRLHGLVCPCDNSGNMLQIL